MTGDIGTLEWAGAADEVTLAKAVSLATDDSILGHDLRRVEVSIPSFDTMAMRALHLAGFRREGLRRQGAKTEDGRLVDVLLYGRLATDQVYGAQAFSAVMDSVLPMKRVIGHVVFTDPEGRVLLQQVSYKDDWELPGGIIEHGESPRVGAQREVLEETGLVVELDAPVLVDWMPPYLGWGDAIEFLWDGGVIDPDALILPDHEVVAFNWVEPADGAAQVTQASARRLAHVLARDGVTFSENGVR
ncbi:MAG TPA: NUDIX hydrolase [Propionibacteriaceae bacterium]|nr:NUDIX hydrolase [Propionibacteriaceae bacterium]